MRVFTVRQCRCASCADESRSVDSRSAKLLEPMDPFTELLQPFVDHGGVPPHSGTQSDTQGFDPTFILKLGAKIRFAFRFAVRLTVGLASWLAIALGLGRHS